MFTKRHLLLSCGLIICVTSVLSAQYGGGTGGGTGGSTGGSTGGATGGAAGGAVTSGSGGGERDLNDNYHVGFDRPEAWGLKYFASLSLLSGLPVPPPTEGTRFGSINIGFEMDWLPQLDSGQQRIGFNGHAPEDLNKAPIFARPVFRIGLPDKFTAIVAAPPPFELFGVRTRMIAFGVERPLVERGAMTVTWRGYGQVGSVKGAFTCPNSAVQFAPGTAGNPTECVGESADVASLRYAGMEFGASYRLPQHPKVIPHAAVGGNFMDLAFQTHAPVVDGMDETRLWTRGGTFTTSGGITYMLTSKAAFTVDAFYTPLWVMRASGGPRTNDGLFNVRALISYTFR